VTRHLAGDCGANVRLWQDQVVYRAVAPLSDVFEGDGASNPGCAPSDGSGLAAEDVPGWNGHCIEETVVNGER
jgi:hypothetical protein